ncbi:amino acid adenylation domain-containing protein [Streptomyces harbinensis]|uniref:non-ribosomal peptide synthetase n=1 Tax=Streptomyces harbinensis TaxID=1176198 RepID=UPI003393AAE1
MAVHDAAAGLSYVSGGEILHAPDWSHLFAALQDAAHRAPDTSIHFYDAEGGYRTTTYAALHDEALRLSHWLTGTAGLRPGDHLVLQIPDGHEYLPLFWAAMHAGVVAVPMSVPAALRRESLEGVSRVLDTLGTGRILLGTPLAEEYPGVLGLLGHDPATVLTFPRPADLPALPDPPPAPAAAPDGTAVIFFTSGSTGVPKGAVQTHRSMLAREAGVMQDDGAPTDVQLNWMPLEHAAGILMSHLRGIRRLSEQVQVAPGHILADPLTLLDLVDRHRVNYTWAPQFAYSLLNNLVRAGNHADWDLSCLREVINAGEMVNARLTGLLCRALAGHGLRPEVFVPVWGMAETCSGVLYNRDFRPPAEPAGTGGGDEEAQHTGQFVSLGRPIPGLEVAVTGPDGTILPEGEVGHLVVRGDCVTPAYFRNPAVNAEAFTADRWFRTGDLARIRDGEVTMTGRAKQILVVNGLNVDLSEVEAAIEELPAVETSFTAAWAHTDPATGEDRAIVFCVPRGERLADLPVEEIRAHVLRRIGVRLHAVVPVRRREIPKTNLGKIQRAKLGARYRDGDFADRAVGESGGDRARAAETVASLVGPGRYLTASPQEADLPRPAVPGTGTPAVLAGLGEDWTRDTVTEAAVRALPGVADARVWTGEVLLPGVRGALAAVQSRLDHPDYREAVRERVARRLREAGATVREVAFATDLTSLQDAELLDAFTTPADPGPLTPAAPPPLGAYRDTVVPAGPPEQAPREEASALLVLSDDPAPVRRLAADPGRLVVWAHTPRIAGQDTAAVPPSVLVTEVDPRDEEGYRSLASTLRAAGAEAVSVAHLWALDGSGDDADAVEEQYRGVFSLQNLWRLLPEAGLLLTRTTVLTRAALGAPAANPGYRHATVSAFVRSAVAEGHTALHIDLSGTGADPVDVLRREERTVADGVSVLYADGVRHTQALAALPLPEGPSPLARRDGFLVVTGGLGGIGRLLVAFLLRRYGRDVLLLGRRAPERAERDLAALRALAREHGGAVSYRQCDLGDAGALRETVEEHRAATGLPLHGVFHLAGVIHEALITDQSAAELRAAYEPKVRGLERLGDLLLERHPDAFLVAFASARSLAPGTTVSGYVSASDFAAHHAALLRSRGLAATSVAWGVWDETGMSRDLRVNRSLSRRGIATMDPLRALLALARVVGTDAPGVHLGVDGARLPAALPVREDRPDLDEVCVVTDFATFEDLFAARAAEIAGALRTAPGGRPARYALLDEVPLDRNGSVDRTGVLGRLDVLRGAVTVEGPDGPLEERIRDICRTVFRVDTIGVTENLFDVGADSIATIQLLARLRDEKVVHVSHQEFYAEPTIRHLARIAAAGGAPAPAPVPAAAAPAPRTAAADGAHPLTPQQRRLWFLFEADPSSPYYNNTVSLTVTGQVAAPLLKVAVMQLIDRHEALRVRFGPDGDGEGGIVQRLVPVTELAPTLTEHDLRALPEDGRAAEVERIIAGSAATPFDLLAEPPVRAAVVRETEDRATIVLTIHHIVSDGWSMGVILSDLAAIHRDLLAHGVVRLDPIDGLYPRYVADVTAYERSEAYRRQLAYWTDQLGDIAVPAELPARAAAGESVTSAGEHLTATVPPEVLAGLRRLAREHDVSLYVLLLAAYAVLHQRLTLSDHVRLGTLVANRGLGDTSGLVGFLANTLPLDLRIDDAQPFSALLEQVKQKVIGLHDNQDVQFDSLVQALQPERAHNKNPLFQVLFALQNAQIEQVTTPEAAWRLRIWESETAKFDLSVQAFEREGRLDLVFEYRRDLFARRDVERWSAAYLTVLADLPGLRDPEVGSLEIVGAAERERILSVNGPLDAPLPPSIPARLAEVVRERPDATALVMGAERFTYAQLWELSGACADRLHAGGVRAGSRVAVMARRSPHVVIAMIAALRLGAAYVPLRPSDPAERRDLVLADSEAVLLLDHAGRTESAVPQLELGAYERPADAAPRPGDAPAADAATTAAYVMYTSGSTGRPKGVVVSAENILRLVHRPEFVALGAHDVVLQTGSLTFDASTLEVWGALLNGAQLHLVDEHVLLDARTLREAIREAGATVMWASAPLFNQIVDADPAAFTGLRNLLVGGDVLSPRHIRAVLDADPGVRVINGYGPTENTTFSTTHPIPADHPADRPVPIGRPIGHSSAYVLGGSGQLQPAGVPGELYVGGRGVALGYLNRPDLTAAAFLDDPFAPGGRMYRTGDLVRLNDDLDIEFIGRVDHQVKIRGFRVELPEIERVARSLPCVREIVVEARPGTGGGLRLVAFWSGDTDRDLRGDLERLLPDYMVPAVLVPLERLPLDRNGKVDRRALAAVEIAPARPESTTGDRQAVAALGPEAAELRRVWAELLGTEAFGADDTFFSLGGDSIQVIQMTNRLRAAGYHLSARDVFENQTIRKLAAVLRPGRAAVAVIEREDTAELAPMHAWILEALGEEEWLGHWNLPLVLDLESDHAPDRIAAALRAVADRHPALRARLHRVDGRWHYEEDLPAADLPVAAWTVTDLAEITGELTELQRGLDPAAGRMLGAAKVTVGTEHKLVLAVHHLVSDGVSLRIMARDLDTALREGPGALPATTGTAGFSAWIAATHRRAASDEVRAQLPHWSDVTARVRSPFPQVILTEGGTVDREFRLPAAATATLSRIGRHVPGAELQHALLATLGDAYAEAFGTDALPVLLEGHGRADVVDDLDLSGTVGWFTSIYPTVLPSGGAPDPVAGVLACRAHLENIPAGGRDYGALAFLAGAVRHPAAAIPVAFNYLGAMPAGMRLADAAYGLFRDPDSRRECAIEVNIFRYGDELKVSVRVDHRFADRPEVARMLTGYEQRLLDLARRLDAAPTGAADSADTGGDPLTAAERHLLRERYGDRIEHVLPLTPTQEGLLYHELMNPGGSDYFGQIVTTLRGALRPEVFEAAWHTVVAENEMLRTVYSWEDLTRPVQVVLREAGFALAHRDLTAEHGAAEAIDAAVEAALAEDIAQGFDLAGGPLLRVTLLRTGPQEHTFVLSFPHLSLDGWSVFRMLSRAMELYDADRTDIVPEPAPPFRRFAHWQRGLDPAAARAYWARHLAGAQPSALPPEAAPADGSEDRFSQLNLVLDTEETTAVRTFAATAGCTLSTVLQTALALSLRIVSGTDEVLFGTTVSGRTPEVEGVESIVGLLINTLPVRVETTEDDDVPQLLQRMQRNGFDALEHGDLATTHILESAGIGAGRSLFDVLFILENYPLGPEHLRSRRLEIGEFASHERTNYRLTVVAVPGDRLTVRFSSTTGAVDPQWVAAFSRVFRACLLQLAEGRAAVADIDGADPAEVAGLLRRSEKSPAVIAAHEDQREFFERFTGPVYVLDDRGRPCPDGVPGQIYAGADSPAALPADGEWAAWMAEGAIAPGFPAPSAFLYPTGDGGRWVNGTTIELDD